MTATTTPLQLAITSADALAIETAIASALSGLAPATRRVYRAHILRWQLWSANTLLDRTTVKAYMRALELQSASAQVRNQALAALKRLAYECAELGWVEPAVSAQIQSIKSKRTSGVRTGKWLTVTQAAALLQAPDRTTLIGRRDRAILALLLGCGLRRAEACALTADQVVLMDGRTILMNVIGKGGRVRSVAVPAWAAQIINEWVKETAQ